MLHQSEIILAYFSNSQEKLHLARLRNHVWQDISHNLNCFLRDPYLNFDDGIWRLVFTESWNSQRIGIATSQNLHHWNQPEFPVLFPGAHHCWAPEFIRVGNSFLIYWSSKITSRHNAIWGCWTDWKSYGQPFLIFDPGYPIIDATIRPKREEWIMAFKDERDECKAIRTARSFHVEYGFTAISELLSPHGSEGPIFYGHDIIYDHYIQNSWGTVSGSTFPVPPDARHGSISRK